jgi:hypothetical protein
MASFNLAIFIGIILANLPNFLSESAIII